jgi:hypothetical protein
MVALVSRLLDRRRVRPALTLAAGGRNGSKKYAGKQSRLMVRAAGW